MQHPELAPEPLGLFPDNNRYDSYLHAICQNPGITLSLLMQAFMHWGSHACDRDTSGHTPLMYLCRNPAINMEMLQFYHSHYPAAFSMRS